MTLAKHFLGIDVGTGSARAGVFDAKGTMLASAKRDIALYREAGDIVEQSSNDIWRAVAASVREAVAKAGVEAASITGIGYDATCSLVVLGEGDCHFPSGRPTRPSATSSCGWTTARPNRPPASTGQARRC